MAKQFIKDPNDVVDFTINWQDTAYPNPLLVVGETIVTSEWILPEGITEESSSNTDTTTTIFISGGINLQRYTVANRITTNRGRVYERSFYLRIMEIFI